MEAISFSFSWKSLHGLLETGLLEAGEAWKRAEALMATMAQFPAYGLSRRKSLSAPPSLPPGVGY